MSLKDANQLVKLYAMVNVAQYQVVSTGATVAQCEQNYLELLAGKGITQIEGPDEVLQVTADGTIAEIRTAVIDGNSVYYLRLEGKDVFYTLSAAKQPEVVTLDVGEAVTVYFTPDILDHGQLLYTAYRVERNG